MSKASKGSLLSRRETFSLLSGGALASFLPASFAADSKSEQFAKGAIIRTLLKDMPPAALTGSAVLFHEHLSMKSSRAMANPNEPHFTDDVDMMIEEVRIAGKEGVGCIVDGGHPDMYRNIDALKRIAKESGVPIVASGGYYMQRTYPAALKAQSADQIAEQLIAEAKSQNLGAFGEIGQEGGVLTAEETKVFQAVGKVQARTGLPIFTHNAYTGTRQPANPVPKDAGLRQLDVLEAAGAQAQQVAIGHMCCLDDPKAEIGIQIAKRGAFVGFDRVTIQQIIPDASRAAMIMAMVDAGYANNVLISSDFYNGASTKNKGGNGVAQAWTVFAPMLRKAGLPEATLHQIMFDNPRRFLAFVPRK
jgi:phosphotriesterase-related protein